MSNLPAPPPESNDDSESVGGNQILNIGSYHYYGNDLKEIGRIAETNPELAEKLIESSDRHHQRSNFSYRFGIMATLVLVAMILATFLTLFILKGIVATFAIVACFSVVALLTRVILTGQWSNDTVVGKAIQRLAKLLGSSE